MGPLGDRTDRLVYPLLLAESLVGWSGCCSPVEIFAFLKRWRRCRPASTQILDLSPILKFLRKMGNWNVSGDLDFVTRQSATLVLHHI